MVIVKVMVMVMVMVVEMVMVMDMVIIAQASYFRAPFYLLFAF